MRHRRGWPAKLLTFCMFGAGACRAPVTRQFELGGQRVCEFPRPTFSPMMDRHFAAFQKEIRAGARPDTWTFLTGDRDAIDRVAARFGASVMRDQRDPRDITHNVRMAVADADGRLAKIFTGDDWKPAELLDEIRKTSGH